MKSDAQASSNPVLIHMMNFTLTAREHATGSAAYLPFSKVHLHDDGTYDYIQDGKYYTGGRWFDQSTDADRAASSVKINFQNPIGVIWVIPVPWVTVKINGNIMSYEFSVAGS